MCGIVGYYGPENPKDVIIKGLKCLEYRGYDSAGVAIFHEGKFKRVRAEGKLSNLELKIKNEKFAGHLGIGHTRWATHGKPSERNAHPHVVSGVSIVHNGIIENYDALKTELAAKGATFDSDTDSELIAHLVSGNLKKGLSFYNAVLSTAQILEGAFAVLVVSEDSPDEMIAFKNGPPLVVGVAKDATYIASDIQAIVPYTKSVIYLEDDDFVYVRGTQVEFFDLQGHRKEKVPTVVQWTADLVEKQGFKHFMLKEIFEQPRAVAQAIEPHIDVQNHAIELKGVYFSHPASNAQNSSGAPNSNLTDWMNTQQTLKKVERIFIVACGTSFYAGMVGKYLVEAFAHVPVEVDIASEFRYRDPVIPENSLLIVISQSGETADTLAALRLAKEKGVQTLSICNVRNSSIDRESNGHLYMNAGPEIGVASTKAFSSTMAVLSIFSLGLAKIKGKISADEEKSVVRALLSLPNLMERVLNYDKFFGQAAQTLKNWRGFLYMGRGVNYPIALEGALKMKELAYKHAEGYAAGEMKHGPLALIDETMMVIMMAPKDHLFEKTLSNLEEVRARGGEVISIGTGENRRLKELSRHYLSLPDAPWFLNPFLEVIPLQLMSYHVAEALNLDVDQPRNLAKSVTVE